MYTDVAVFTIYFARCRIKSFSLRACRPVPNRLEKIFFTIKVLGFTLLRFYVEKCPKLERERARKEMNAGQRESDFESAARRENDCEAGELKQFTFQQKTKH